MRLYNCRSRTPFYTAMCQTGVQAACTCPHLIADVKGGKYSLMPKVSPSDGFGASRRKVDGSYSFSSANATDGDASKSTSSLPSTKSKPNFIDRVFGGKSKASKPPGLEDVDQLRSILYTPTDRMPKGTKSQELGEVSQCSSIECITTVPFTSPAPYLQPLKHKMEARIEPIRLPNQPSGREPGPVIVSKETLWHPLDTPIEHRIRLEVYEVLPSNEQLDSSEQGCLGSSGPTASPEQTLDERIQFILDHEIDDLAHLWGTDPATKSAWHSYLTNYSQGKFNLTYPPAAPFTGPSFTYLPALLSSSEIERMDQASAFHNIWPTWKANEGPTQLLMAAAMQICDLPDASISFFDDKYELIRSASWYPKSRTLRKTSLAAHALLTADVFVVADTKKDWRFRRHPQVVGGAHIRFFACAPLLSIGGFPVGLLSVWDNKPRDIWTPQQRAELARMSTSIMANLETEMDRLRGPNMRFTPLLERHSTVNANYWGNPRSSRHNEVDPSLCPNGLRINKTPPMRPSQFSGQIESNLTPPSSADSNQQFVSPGGGNGKNHKELRLNSINDVYPDVAEMITPDSNKFGSLSSPRPYSGSDITSVHGHPPNTPHVSFISGRFPQPPYEKRLRHLKHQDLADLTVDDFHSLSYDDVAEDPTFISADTPLAETAIATHPTVDLSPTSRLQRKFPAAPEVPETSSLSFQSNPNSMPNVMRHWAEDLGYDRMYVLSLKATDRRMIDEAKLFAPGGLDCRIVAAYGLYETLELNIPLHFSAIRSRGVIVYEAPTERRPTETYANGLLIAIHTQGGSVQKRNSGMVLAAFRKNPRHQSVKIEEEHNKLKQAADAIGNILREERNGWPLSNRPKHIDPPNSIRYPANEAVEVGNPSIGFRRDSITLTRTQTSSRQSLHRGESRQDKNDAQIDPPPADIDIKKYPPTRTASRQKNLNSDNSLAIATRGPEFSSRQPTAQLDSREVSDQTNFLEKRIKNSLRDLNNNRHAQDHGLFELDA